VPPGSLAVEGRDPERNRSGHPLGRGEFLMRQKMYGVAVVIFGLLLGAAPAPAHHSVLATYDTNKVIYITGTLTRFDWTNPHMFVYVDATDSDGKVTRWVFEGASPNLVARTGTHREDFVANTGKTVTVRACPAKDGSPKGSAETIKMSDGRELPFGGKRFAGDQK
jgi:Family of unknown function (DUF6152)